MPRPRRPASASSDQSAGMQRVEAHARRALTHGAIAVATRAPDRAVARSRRRTCCRARTSRRRSGRDQSSAVALAARLLPQPCMPRRRSPFGASRPKARASGKPLDRLGDEREAPRRQGVRARRAPSRARVRWAARSLRGRRVPPSRRALMPLRRLPGSSPQALRACSPSPRPTRSGPRGRRPAHGSGQAARARAAQQPTLRRP